MTSQNVSGRPAAGALFGTVATLTILLATPGCDANELSSNTVHGSAKAVAAQSGELKTNSGEPPLQVARDLAHNAHPTHPTMYHDSQLIERDGKITVGWNGVGNAWLAQLRTSDLSELRRRRLNHVALGGNTDSTKTDTDRHDIPAVTLDQRGGLHFLYGGGTLAGRKTVSHGPFYRRSAANKSVKLLSKERKLDLGGGSAYDFEQVRDRDGTVHLFGQRSRFATGSLVELRIASSGKMLPVRDVVRGGFNPRGCVTGGRPLGCNRFAISRVAIENATGRMHLTWGFSERSLLGECRTDLGYCNRDLYYAYSDDNGSTWHNAASTVTVTTGKRAIYHADRRFLVASGAISLFKAIAPTPDGALLLYGRPNASGATDLYSAKLSGKTWQTDNLVAAAGDLSVRTWACSLVSLARAGAITVWASTGSKIVRLRSPDGLAWSGGVAYHGKAWSMTGSPTSDGKYQLLIWRAAHDDKHPSTVMIGKDAVG